MHNPSLSSEDAPPRLTRRRFATSAIGTACAAATLPALTGPAVGQLATPSRVERLRAMFNLLARDTLAGVSAFAVPGSDLYSLWQGLSTFQVGGVAARNDAFLTFMFDNYLPLPPPLGGTLGMSLGASLRGLSLPLGDGTTLNLGNALTELLNATDSLPLSTLLALLLNALALTVQPASLVGPFLSPFSRLSWKNKARVLELLENPGPEVMRAMGPIPDPLLKTVIGYVQLIAVGLLAFAGFGSYSEWAALDPATRTLRSRPVGWALSKYQPNGPVEGWDDFKGYYQNRRSASDA
ncbi:MAG TPA: hypothetical protein H9903_19370 [Candidatus Aquabacterium excrementipullorum]|nr:hypothetical protein [Candidatus Aquabacterium excrementipullorum]